MTDRTEPTAASREPDPTLVARYEALRAQVLATPHAHAPSGQGLQRHGLWAWLADAAAPETPHRTDPDATAHASDARAATDLHRAIATALATMALHRLREAPR